jgi:hypothetical protein|tara:strand:+ start:251 stop:385 length:135 start_codon:yes stop_codon:yes gene_type:complete
VAAERKKRLILKAQNQSKMFSVKVFKERNVMNTRKQFDPIDLLK